MKIYFISIFKRSLRAKLIGIFMLFLIVIVGFELLYFPNQQKTQSLEMANTQTKTLCDMLAFSVGAGLKDANFELVQTAFEWAKRDSSVIFISILDENNNSIVEHNPRLLNIDKSTISKSEGVIDGDSYLTVVAQIKYQNKHYGSIILGYSMDQINSIISSQQWTSFLIALLMFAVGAVTISFVTKLIVNSFRDLLKGIEKFSEGDLRVRTNMNREDEIGQLCVGFNKALEKVNSMMLTVNESVVKTIEASSQIGASTEQLAAGSQEQASQASEVASAVEEMTKTIIENSKNATATSDKTKETSSAAQNGVKISQETRETINRVVESAVEVTSIVNALGSSSDRIGDIITVIDDIADQTNLLALNAAIEAARAGEQGRGFAVVADEVRKLAERTTKATKEIYDLIKTIQTDTGRAVKSMEVAGKVVNEGMEMTRRTGEALEKIVMMTNEVTDMVTQIAAASEEQSSASEQISKNVEAISNVTSESAQGTQQIAKTADELYQLTQNLQQLISKFQLLNPDDRNHDRNLNFSSKSEHNEKSNLSVRSNGILVHH